MKTALAMLLSLAPVLALGTTTWSELGSDPITQVCTSGTETLPEPSSVWSRTATYAAGETVAYRGTPYVSLQASNSKHVPDTDSAAWWRPVGLSIWHPKFVIITVCADPGQTITRGAFDMYIWDSKFGSWARFNSAPYKTATGVRCVVLQGDSAAIGIMVLATGDDARLAVVPAGAAVSSGNITIYYRINDR